MAKAKELVVMLENRPGMLAKLGNALREADVNITAILASNQPGKSPVHILVDNVPPARKALQAQGFDVEERTVVTLELENRPGTLGTAMSKIALKGINIDYCYYSVTQGRSAFVVLGVKNPDRVAALL